MWRETTKHERNLKIFREELDDFLPGKILDFHVHVLNRGVMPEGEEFSCGGRPPDGTPASRRVVGVSRRMPDQSGPDGHFIADDQSR